MLRTVVSLTGLEFIYHFCCAFSLQSFETSLLLQNSSEVKHQPTLLKYLVGSKPELPLRVKNEGMSQGVDSVSNYNH